MQHARFLCPLFALAAVLPAAAATPDEACKQLRTALEQELAILEPLVDAAGADAALPKLDAVLKELAAMDSSPEAQKALWEYIDNTEGVKLPLVELLQCLAMEFARLEKADFFGHEGLRAALAPQVTPPAPKEDEEFSVPTSL